MLKILKLAERNLIWINKTLITLLFFLMFILVFANVVTRYLFSFSMNWAEEISRFLMIWVAYLGIGLAMKEGHHASVQILQDALPSKAYPYARGFVAIVMIVFMIIVTYLGIDYSRFAMDQQTAAMLWPVGIIYLAIPIGSLLFIIHMISAFADYVSPKHIGESAEMLTAIKSADRRKS
ncbi:MAG TPA: TRAP transporter small permease [Bacillota bacterium]|nr:TRAP transporter small permease [Bacillota bacterium]HOA15285.1 TRAP transporter small permease [Bacillota bacterium]